MCQPRLVGVKRKQGLNEDIFLEYKGAEQWGEEEIVGGVDG